MRLWSGWLKRVKLRKDGGPRQCISGRRGGRQEGQRCSYNNIEKFQAIHLDSIVNGFCQPIRPAIKTLLLAIRLSCPLKRRQAASASPDNRHPRRTLSALLCPTPGTLHCKWQISSGAGSSPNPHQQNPVSRHRPAERSLKLSQIPLPPQIPHPMPARQT